MRCKNATGSRSVFKNVLFVCVGNICRSPSAEVMLRQAVEGRGIQVSSAGLGALVGHGIDATAQELLVEQGMDGLAHRARQIDDAILGAADLVLTMERKHVRRIAEIAPQASGKPSCWAMAAGSGFPILTASNARHSSMFTS